MAHDVPEHFVSRFPGWFRLWWRGRDNPESAQRAVSMFVDPTGAQIGDFLQNEEGILYGEFDLAACVEPKQYHDIVGNYNRFDVFDLRITRKRPPSATWIDSEAQSFPSLLSYAVEKEKPSD
jgi:hypothetical protein